MSVQLQVSESIDRPVVNVFHFFAEEHVHNHPRWDPFMRLEQVSDGPIGVGTIIKRINSRSGTPVEGTMEVVEFEPNRAIGMIIHDGPVEMRGRTTFEAVSDGETTLTINVEIPSMDGSMEGMMRGAIQKSLQNIKQLIESEVKE
ncbi:MAG TPA: SRPBCC family protein [Anaerolineales bacterium]